MKTRFETGKVTTSQGVPHVIAMWQAGKYLDRHRMGDWGCVCDADWSRNDEAVEQGRRILSAYPIDPNKPHKGSGDNVVWIITEADRSATTILLPKEATPP